MTADTLRSLLRPGSLVTVGDGAGSPRRVLPSLADAARQAGGVRLLLGWSFGDWSAALDREAFTEVRTVMSGYALRRPLREGAIGYLPIRLGSAPALLSATLRPDVAVVSATPADGGLAHATEVSWMAAAVDNARAVVAAVDETLPFCSGEALIDPGRITASIAVHGEGPALLPPATLDDASRRIGELVASLVPAGAAVQYGPGRIGEACLAALREPVHIDTGVINDAVVDLDERGLLLGTPAGAYVVGSERVYEWARGRGVARRIEHTHDLTRLASRPFVAVNTALQIDRFGQVNVESIGPDPIGGIGGHGDYAMAGTRSPGGVSIIALPRTLAGKPTLVDQLDAPVSTAYSDVQVVVTETGIADLRGLDRAGRARAIESLWTA